MTNHHEITREIYQKQHERISGDADATDRIFGMYDNATFGVDANWFPGKNAIDIGCGNIGALLVRLNKLGVGKVLGVDIGTDWINSLTEVLLRNGLSHDSFNLKTGSVLDIPHADNSIDFVAINGVLIHLEDMAEIQRGFLEGVRITRRGGYLYTSWGPCGGLMQGVILPAVRAHYRNNQEFKQFIDAIDPTVFHRVIDKVVNDTFAHTGETLDRDFLVSLFGEDYCVFLQNFIQAPTWYSNECSPAYVENLYRQAGFTDVKRLGSFVKRKDIRKFFAPLHYDTSYDVSKVLYGEGYVQYVGKKPE